MPCGGVKQRPRQLKLRRSAAPLNDAMGNIVKS